MSFDGRRIERLAAGANRRARHRAHVPARARVRQPERARQRAGRRAHAAEGGAAEARVPIAELWAALVRPRAVREEQAELRRGGAKTILARFGDRLLPRLDHPAYSLSYANRRRVEIARALALRPRLLLLDEPTAGMNPTETAEMQALIGDLKATGLTILLIEHKLDMVMRLSDRVYVLDDGRQIAAGPPAEVRDDPAVIEAYLGTQAGRPRSASGGRGMTPLLALERVDTFYGPVQAHFELIAVGRRGAHRLSARRQRQRQIDDDEGDPGAGLAARRAKSASTGQRIDGLPTHRIVRLGIGSVPEARRLFPVMTVRENLLMGAYARDDRAAVRQDLERVLALFPARRRPARAAGRHAVGRRTADAGDGARADGPAEADLMDEPTMGLSPLWVDRVLELIATINKQGTTIFMVEQNANLALQIAHDAYVLQTGRIVLEGSAADASRRSAHPRRLSRRRARRLTRTYAVIRLNPARAASPISPRRSRGVSPRAPPSTTGAANSRSTISRLCTRPAISGSPCPANTAARRPTYSTWSSRSRYSRAPIRLPRSSSACRSTSSAASATIAFGRSRCLARSAATSPSMAAAINTCATEADLGSVSRGGAPAASATPTEGGYLINGRKIFVTGAPGLRWFVTLVRLPPSADAPHGEVASALVRAGAPGLSIKDGVAGRAEPQSLGQFGRRIRRRVRRRTNSSSSGGRCRRRARRSRRRARAPRVWGHGR